MEVDMEEIIEVLKELEEDTTVPRNVKDKIKNTIDALKEEGDLKIRVNKALHELDEIADDPNLPTYLLCSTGNRSSLGASILKQKGFQNVNNVAGGITGYSAAGHAPECPVCFVPHGPRFSGSKNPK